MRILYNIQLQLLKRSCHHQDVFYFTPTKRPKTERPPTESPNTKRPKPQNVLNTKRPKPQSVQASKNVPTPNDPASKCPQQKNIPTPKMSQLQNVTSLKKSQAPKRPNHKTFQLSYTVYRDYSFQLKLSIIHSQLVDFLENKSRILTLPSLCSRKCQKKLQRVGYFKI